MTDLQGALGLIQLKCLEGFISEITGHSIMTRNYSWNGQNPARPEGWGIWQAMSAWWMRKAPLSGIVNGVPAGKHIDPT